MYLAELFDIHTEVKGITQKNFVAIDKFFGDVGENALFTRTDIMRNLTQKQLTDPILRFLANRGLIAPYNQRCGNCGGELPYPSSECDNCGQPVEPGDSVFYYKVTATLELSDTERRLRREQVNRLQFSSYRMLIKKIERKIKIHEPGTLLFFDIANSTSILKSNRFFYSFLAKSFREFIVSLSRPLLLESRGIHLKSDGDSSHVFLDSLADARSFLLSFRRDLMHQEFMEKLMEYNSRNESNVIVYFKIFEAQTEIIEFFQKELFLLDFGAMEAFQYINRIEKKAKTVLLREFSNDETPLFPAFLIAKERIFASRVMQIPDVQDFGNQNVHFSLWSDIEDTAEI